MMKKNFRTLWMPAAILCCGLLMTSCVDESAMPDNPTPKPEEASAKDNGKWTIDESFVDNSVKPGDDFFMHRIGKWWAATTVDDDPEYFQVEGFMNDLVKGLVQMTNGATKNSGILFQHLNALRIKEAEPDMSAKALLYSGQVTADCGYPKACDEAIAQNDATPMWKAIGRMMAKGAPTPFSFDPLFHKGKTVLFLAANKSLVPVYTASVLSDQLHRNGEFIKALVPLTSKAGTRGIDGSKWPHLVAMIKEAGIDPADVYLWAENASDYNLDPNLLEQVKSNADLIKKLNDSSPEELQKEMQKCFNDEAAIMSYEEYQKAVEDFKKRGENLSIIKIYAYYYKNYMQYELSHDIGVQYVTPEMRQAGIERCKELIDVFADRIKASQWLSDQGKKETLEKLDNMIINVGCPEKWITEAIPDLSKSQSPLEDVYLLRKAAFNFMKYVAGKPAKETSFHVLLQPKTKIPLSVLNAFYIGNCNAINIYPWWLMPPLYDPTQNQAINYAYLVATAHEITHGFDSQGCLYDKNGDFASLFTNPADKAAFQQLSKKLVDRFNELDVMVIPGEKSNGEFCLGENIADLGGVEIAFEAYTRYLEKNGFKGEEMAKQQRYFFCGFTEFHRGKYGPNYTKMQLYGNKALNVNPDIHSLNRERVNGTFRNVDAWYQLFGVKPGDKLYLAPAARVHIW